VAQNSEGIAVRGAFLRCSSAPTSRGRHGATQSDTAKEGARPRAMSVLCRFRGPLASQNRGGTDARAAQNSEGSACGAFLRCSSARTRPTGGISERPRKGGRASCVGVELSSIFLSCRCSSAANHLPGSRIGLYRPASQQAAHPRPPGLRGLPLPT
jgi:hypothetical protein